MAQPPRYPPAAQPVAPPYASAATPPNEPSAVTAMVLGILGLAVCTFIAPFAWSIGKKSLNNCRAAPGRYAGEGMAMAGYVMGIIGSILLIVVGVILVIYFVFIAVVIGSVFAAT